MDFTIKVYKKLLSVLQHREYSFITLADYAAAGFQVPGSSKFVIFRNDVDARPENSLHFARIQAERGIACTYYFRMLPKKFNEAVIKEVSELGHETGYHYETMHTSKGDVDAAYDEFCRNLEKFRKIVPVKTISMHGSPMSPYDNRDIWKKYDYRSLGIIAEPYFDLNFNEIFYLIDTGRSWDGHLYNIRDKTIVENPLTNPEFLDLRFHSTADIITALTENSFPERAMFNFHPQRWTSRPIPWLKEFVLQNMKNQVKRIMVKHAGR